MTGPVGYCASVVAASRADAVTRLQALLKQHGSEHMVARNEGPVEYLQVYFNADILTADSIDDEECCVEGDAPAIRLDYQRTSNNYLPKPVDA
jgi:hypothetical protein